MTSVIETAGLGKRLGWFVFPCRGITPLGYAAFAFAVRRHRRRT